ncbi:hypothetical protein ART_0582 [Arthrobacter sp. PAMC 25486]|nr:hypothetical protein ART_0582 [Arthrobacter sp. PAMC 25486]
MAAVVAEHEPDRAGTAMPDARCPLPIAMVPRSKELKVLAAQ